MKPNSAESNTFPIAVGIKRIIEIEQHKLIEGSLQTVILKQKRGIDKINCQWRFS